MSQSTDRICTTCHAPLSPAARFCTRCGTAVAVSDGVDEVAISGGRQLHLAQEALSLRELMAVVEAGVAWWRKRLSDTDAVSRQQAADAIKELSRILDSLAQQLAQGRETVRITSRLPAVRTYAQACPVCGRGNRAEARFCVGCGAPLGRGITLPSMRIVIAMRTDIGRARPMNEDTCTTGQLMVGGRLVASLLLVADGMGGAQAGEEASQQASEYVAQELTLRLNQRQPESDEEWQTLLRAVVRTVNERVYAYARANPAKLGMGTTLTALVINERRIHLAHIGDSRAYLFNSGGVRSDGATWMQLTLDHTIVARLVDIGQLTPKEARTHPQRTMLYRSLGTDPQVEVDTASHAVQQGDTLLLCSDGLTTYLEDAEIAQLVAEDRPPAALCEHLVRLANERGGRDNISTIIARVY